jgi:hypothetical protein
VVSAKTPLAFVLILFQCRFMDWKRAIDINRTALTKILAEIFAMLGLVAGGLVEHLPYALYVKAERILRPAESALRRLIVIAARGIVVKPSVSRPMPKGIFIAGDGRKRAAFRLFDARPRFEFNSPENPSIVMVETYTANPFNPFDAMYHRAPEKPFQFVSAAQFCRRLAAAAHALETIPTQARRLLRWQARRKKLELPKFISALRPGTPPGHRDKPRSEVDYILQECHFLAWDAQRMDSS